MTFILCLILNMFMYVHFLVLCLTIDFVKVYCIIIPIYNEFLNVCIKSIFAVVTVPNKIKIKCNHQSQNTHKFNQNYGFLLNQNRLLEASIHLPTSQL